MNRKINQVVDSVTYPLREYSIREIKDFIKQDRISPVLRKKVKRLLK